MNDETKRDIAELMQWQERAYTRLVRLEPKLKQAAEVYATSAQKAYRDVMGEDHWRDALRRSYYAGLIGWDHIDIAVEEGNIMANFVERRRSGDRDSVIATLPIDPSVADLGALAETTYNTFKARCEKENAGHAQQQRERKRLRIEALQKELAKLQREEGA